MKAKAILTMTVAIYFLAIAVNAVAGDTPAPQSTPALKQAVTSGKKTIVFFLNPTGKPCRAQNEILQKIMQERGNKINVAYVDATKQEDGKAFYDYGIRGLPSIVMVDSLGKINRVFPPGIQGYDTLVHTLDIMK